MLESMIDAPRPTRAEINDIANSVLDGADAVMLSAETASGKYPILAVESMANTILQVETSTDKIYFRYHAHVNEEPTKNVLNDNVVMSGCRLARDTKARAVIGITTSGYTAFRLSHHRPKADLYIFSSDARLRNTLGLYWGVQVLPYTLDLEKSIEDTVDEIKNVLVERNSLESGDIFINTLSMPLSQQNKTNLVKLSVVD
jgi:pyruvate kinase